ncbi:MAG: sigma-54 dependent transcriptional regulator [candidate division KSB1 bacterium]|jgi:DNA-binding NtrC family response regulator|nr:sigma-54 dependent transcriptional regulator [candidate division KSB1 bacterium]
MALKSFNILVADDEEIIRTGIQQILVKDGHKLFLAMDGIEALKKASECHIDIAFVDLKMPKKNGLEVLNEIKIKSPSTEVVIITGYATVETAVDAMKNGAYDYISKPFTPNTIRLVLQKIQEKHTLLTDSVKQDITLEFNDSHDVIVGSSVRMLQTYELIHKVAPTDSTILITGESGTGKELIAKAIHHNSLRRGKPFLTVDCGSLVETLFESELFGHIKGSFTGAVATKHGSFELAHKGSFFFDEISNISLSIQAKILRAIQEKEIKRVGATETIKVDVRVIAATNEDLRSLVEQGTFREDLFYRLSVIPIHLPPLRERKDDIIALTTHFLQKYNKRRDRNIRGISDRVRNLLLNYQWPGNVRELENVMERAVVIEDSDQITFSSLPGHIKNEEMNTRGFEASVRPLEEIEMDYISKALKMTNWNRSKTARLLGIDRKTLYDKIKKYNIQK